MRWYLIPAAATLPLLAIACTDSPSDTDPAKTPTTSQPASRQANAPKPVLTYFNIPG